MTEILLSQIGKKFYRWVFRNLNYTFRLPCTYGIAGANGSGKSTLLKIVSGYLSPTTGNLKYYIDGEEVDPDNRYRFVSFTGPDVDLIEELTLEEIIAFQQKFSPYTVPGGIEEVLHLTGLEPYSHIRIKYLSSGMKQRLKVGMALLMQTPVLLLDEPSSFLDYEHKLWFRDMFQKFSGERITLVASNDNSDLDLCEEIIEIGRFSASD
jgi:ABC-type multidrug transport system ATPase subunit